GSAPRYNRGPVARGRMDRRWLPNARPARASRRLRVVSCPLTLLTAAHRYERPCDRKSYCFNKIASSHCLPQGLGPAHCIDYSRDLRLTKWGSGVSLHSNNPNPPMSALGQKQTLRYVRRMSALPPKADIGTQPRNVRFVPKADIRRCSKIN